MSKPQNHTPKAFSKPSESFGNPRAALIWRLPRGATLEQLRSAIVQHHAAAQFRAHAARRGITQRAFAQMTAQHEQRISTVLTGAAGMQIYDIGNAAILGPETVPSPDRVAYDVLAYAVTTTVRPPRPPRRPDLGTIEFGTGSSGAPRTVVRMNVEREPDYSDAELAAEARVVDALKPVLTQVLELIWPEPASRSVEIWARTTGFYSLSGQAIEGEDGVIAHAHVDPDWDDAVLAPGHAVLDGVFVLRVLERDDDDRPRSAVGLRKCLDLGTLCLTSCELDVTWDDAGRPHVAWRGLERGSWLRPAD